MSKVVNLNIGGSNQAMEIRWSIDEDLENIYAWLQEEEASGVEGNFLCNWDLTEQSHCEGTLLVLVDSAENLPIGYQLGGLLSSGILQIRHQWRRKGLGRLLVERCVELAYEKDEVVLSIECKPSSSIPFWRAMGFQIIKHCHEKPKGYRILPKKLTLPDESVSSVVRVSSYREERKWNHESPPLRTVSLEAARSTDGTVFLSERASFFRGCHDEIGDPVIEIEVDGKVVYCDKAKYPQACEVGVQRCRNGFFVDKVHP